MQSEKKGITSLAAYEFVDDLLLPLNTLVNTQRASFPKYTTNSQNNGWCKQMYNIVPSTCDRRLIPVETRRQNNSAFQTRLQEARRANLLINSDMVDGDQSSEESPD